MLGNVDKPAMGRLHPMKSATRSRISDAKKAARTSTRNVVATANFIRLPPPKYMHAIQTLRVRTIAGKQKSSMWLIRSNSDGMSAVLWCSRYFFRSASQLHFYGYCVDRIRESPYITTCRANWKGKGILVFFKLLAGWRHIGIVRHER